MNIKFMSYVLFPNVYKTYLNLAASERATQATSRRTVSFPNMFRIDNDT